MPKLLERPPLSRRSVEPAPFTCPRGFPSPERLSELDAPPDGTEMSEAEALKLGLRLKLFCEWADGRVSYPPMPTEVHQRITTFLWDALRHAARDLGHDAIAIVAPFFVRVPHRLREPDVVMLLSKQDPRRGNDVWDGADLAVEVVSPDDPNRDLVEKRREYAAAGIPEYWIVDPRPGHRCVAVLTLENGTYRGEFVGEGGTVESRLLPGFTVAVADCLDPD